MRIFLPWWQQTGLVLGTKSWPWPMLMNPGTYDDVIAVCILVMKVSCCNLEGNATWHWAWCYLCLSFCTSCLCFLVHPSYRLCLYCLRCFLCSYVSHCPITLLLSLPLCAGWSRWRTALPSPRSYSGFSPTCQPCLVSLQCVCLVVFMSEMFHVYSTYLLLLVWHILEVGVHCQIYQEAPNRVPLITCTRESWRYKYNNKSDNSPSTNQSNDRNKRFPVVIALNQPIARQGGKPAWWLAPVNVDRKQKEMYCSPAPAAERIQIAGRSGMGY